MHHLGLVPQFCFSLLMWSRLDCKKMPLSDKALSKGYIILAVHSCCIDNDVLLLICWRRGMMQVFGHIVQKEGPKTLWSGLIPVMIQQFSIATWSKLFFSRHSVLVEMCAWSSHIFHIPRSHAKHSPGGRKQAFRSLASSDCRSFCPMCGWSSVDAFHCDQNSFRGNRHYTVLI